RGNRALHTERLARTSALSHPAARAAVRAVRIRSSPDWNHCSHIPDACPWRAHLHDPGKGKGFMRVDTAYKVCLLRFAACDMGLQCTAARGAYRRLEHSREHVADDVAVDVGETE